MLFTSPHPDTIPSNSSTVLHPSSSFLSTENTSLDSLHAVEFVKRQKRWIFCMLPFCCPCGLWVGHYHLRIWTQRVTFEPSDPSAIWSEWHKEKRNEWQKNLETKKEKIHKLYLNLKLNCICTCICTWSKYFLIDSFFKGGRGVWLCFPTEGQRWWRGMQCLNKKLKINLI